MVKLKDIIRLFESTYKVKLTKYGVKKLTEFCLVHGTSQVYETFKVCINKYNHIDRLFNHIGDIFADDECIYIGQELPCHTHYRR